MLPWLPVSEYLQRGSAAGTEDSTSSNDERCYSSRGNKTAKQAWFVALQQYAQPMKVLRQTAPRSKLCM